MSATVTVCTRSPKSIRPVTRSDDSSVRIRLPAWPSLWTTWRGSRSIVAIAPLDPRSGAVGQLARVVGKRVVERVVDDEAVGDVPRHEPPRRRMVEVRQRNRDAAEQLADRPQARQRHDLAVVEGDPGQVRLRAARGGCGRRARHSARAGRCGRPACAGSAAAVPRARCGRAPGRDSRSPPPVRWRWRSAGRIPRRRAS